MKQPDPEIQTRGDDGYDTWSLSEDMAKVHYETRVTVILNG